MTEELDDLLLTVEKEAEFLARCYWAAIHLGVHQEYKHLLERAIKLKPKKVRAAAETFGALARIYGALHQRGMDERRILIDDGHWTGQTASSFNGYFKQVMNHMGTGSDGGGSYGLTHVAGATKKLLDAFAEALINWRNAVAEAIRETAEADRERRTQTREKLLDIPAFDPITPIAKAAEALISAIDAKDKEASKKDLIWFKEFAEAMNVELAIPNDNEYTENYFNARSTFTKEILEVHPGKLREAIGNLLGIAQAAGEIPAFLQGEHTRPSVWLKPEDLGNVDNFYNSWTELCQWRENEARDIAGVLRHTAQRLSTALADFVDTDQEIAATFPEGQEEPLLTTLRKNGLDLDEAPETVHGYADDGGPQPNDNRVPEHTAEEDHHNVPRGPE